MFTALFIFNLVVGNYAIAGAIAVLSIIGEIRQVCKTK